MSSFLNLFLLFGAVFAFPAVVINSVFVTMIYVYDLRNGFASYSGSGSLVRRYFFYLFVAVLATILGACFMKYTPGILHKYAAAAITPHSAPCPTLLTPPPLSPGEVPPLDWHRDFETWTGLGGWLLVNVAFGSISLIAGCGAETWVSPPRPPLSQRPTCLMLVVVVRRQVFRRDALSFHHAAKAA